MKNVLEVLLKSCIFVINCGETTPVSENMEYLAVYMWFRDFMLLLIIWQNSVVL